VSTDFVNDARSSIVDAPCTQVSTQLPCRTHNTSAFACQKTCEVQQQV
jgi:hypothetical protein